MLKLKTAILLACITSLTLVVCKFGTDEGNTKTVKALRIDATEISPWSESAKGFQDFANLNELTVIMNGGADEYYNRGAIDGFFQSMSNKINESTTYDVECRVMDFGSTDNATTMFNYKIEDVSTKQQAGTIDLASAVVDPDGTLNGCKGYAHFGQYFFELSYTGYGANKTEATKNASSFIEVFKKKVSDL